jgi:hypothetical protein
MCEIGHCHYAISGYCSNRLLNMNKLHDCMLYNRSQIINKSFVWVYCIFSVNTDNNFMWILLSLIEYVKEMVNNWLFVCIIHGIWCYILSSVYFLIMYYCKIIYEKPGEVNSMKTIYKTVDETAHWILSDCYTTTERFKHLCASQRGRRSEQ